MENKKIKNATKVVYEDIKFKSKLEEMCYKVLKDGGFNPLYEQKKYTLFDGFLPHVPFYTKNVFKRKNKNVSTLSNSTAVDNRVVQSWIYTPDLYFEYNDYVIHIEVKGYYNDVARYKMKLFRKNLEEMQKNDPLHIYEFWEIHTKKQLLECIKHIKDEKEL